MLNSGHCNRFVRLDARRRVKVPRTKYPLNAERAYQKQLRAYARFAYRLLRREILKALPKLTSEARSVIPKEIKQDALPQDIDEIFNRVLGALSEEYTEAELRRIALRTGRSVDDVIAESIENQWQKVLAINPVISEAGLQRFLEQKAIENVSLIQSIPLKRLETIKTGMLNALNSGRRAEDVSAAIETILEKSGDAMESNADLIARDQLGKLTGQLNQFRQVENGVSRYVWSTSLDERVRPEHAEREGKIFSWDDPPEDGHPGEPINCRCVAIPVFEE